MAANYPTIVRKFQPHQDGTEYVMAAHMNTVQDEMVAVQSTLGTQPSVYTANSGSTTGYGTVANRLNEIQRMQDAQQRQIDSLLDASKEGWSLPIAGMFASGTPIPATRNTQSVQPSDWYSMRWSRASIDTHGAYSPGPYLTIPKTGWWILTTRIMMRNPTIPNTVEHIVWGRMRILSTNVSGQIIDYDLAAGDSSAQGDAQGWHRITLAAAWDFYAGDRVAIQCRHDYLATEPGQTITEKPVIAAGARLQVTYIRALPDGAVRDSWQLADEIGT